jgi:hypothetical protein
VTTNIEWTDETWNPIRGCTRISHGCTNCYAERQAIRQSAPGKPYHGLVRSTLEGPRWTGAVAFDEETLEQPLHWTRKRRVFVNSMSDLFHASLGDEKIDRVLAVMAMAPKHTFQVLTKRASRLREYLEGDARARVANVIERRFDWCPTRASRRTAPMARTRRSSGGRCRTCGWGVSVGGSADAPTSAYPHLLARAGGGAVRVSWSRCSRAVEP